MKKKKKKKKKEEEEEEEEEEKAFALLIKTYSNPAEEVRHKRKN